MTIEELKTAVKSVMEDTISMQMYFLLRKGDAFELRLADIEDDSTAPELQRMFSEYIQNSIIDNDDLQLCKLSSDDERTNAIYLYDYDTYPEELSAFNDFDISTTLAPVPKFDFTKDALSTLFGYIIYLGTMKTGILLFKKHYPVSLIKRDSFLLGMKKSRQRFEKISGEDVIRMNSTSHLIKVDEQIYVMDIKVLEQNMKFTELIQKAAKETIKAVDELGILEDITVIEDSIAEVGFARKLSKVQRESPIFKLRISKETIVEFTKTTPALAGKFKYGNDGATIRLDTKKSKEAFVKLMNDAFLRSELTKQYYEASAKDQLEADT